MASFSKGQILVGLRNSYRLLEQAHRHSPNVWIGATTASVAISSSGSSTNVSPNSSPPGIPSPSTSSSSSVDSEMIVEQAFKNLDRTKDGTDKVIIKTADKFHLEREVFCLKLLQRYEGHERHKAQHIRQLIDSIAEPPSMVLEYMDENLWSLSKRRKLQNHEIKTIAHQVLLALSFMHSRDMVHTDLKPHNVLLSGIKDDGLNNSNILVKVADLGSADEPSSHPISPSAFRAPEAWLELPWDTKADIWSFGSIIGGLMLGPNGELHGSSAKDEITRDLEKLQAQNRMLGKYPASLLSRASEDWQRMFEDFNRMDEERPRMTWGLAVKKLDISEEDGSFIERVMKHDPEQRPSADELLRDPWFDGIGGNSPLSSNSSPFAETSPSLHPAVKGPVDGDPAGTSPTSTPFLSSIPFLGNLFEKVFSTPHPLAIMNAAKGETAEMTAVQDDRPGKAEGTKDDYYCVMQ